MAPTRCASRCSPAGTPGNDLKLSVSRVEANRNFANKIWNAARFVVMRLEDDAQELDRSDPNSPTYALPPAAALSLADRWILSRYASVRDDVTRLIESWQLGEAGRQLYEFLWNEYCDWYIEAAKVRLGEGRRRKPRPRARCSPMCWSAACACCTPSCPSSPRRSGSNLPGLGAAGAASIMVTRWPEELARVDAAAETDFGRVQEVVRAIRNVRSEYDVPAAAALRRRSARVSLPRSCRRACR
jgi:valyl-tRNA synthetase